MTCFCKIWPGRYSSWHCIRILAIGRPIYYYCILQYGVGRMLSTVWYALKTNAMHKNSALEEQKRHGLSFWIDPVFETSCRGIQWMSCLQMMFATDMVKLCYRHCFQSSLPFDPHILQGAEECQDITGSWMHLIPVKQKRITYKYKSVSCNFRHPSAMSNFQQGPQDLFVFSTRLSFVQQFRCKCLLCTLRTWDPFFPWHVSLSSAPQPKLQGISSLLLMDGGQEVETAAARCKAGMPCQRSERPKFLLKSASWSPIFLGLNKTSGHRYVNIPFTVLYWTASLKWAWCAFVSSVWPSKPCNLTWSCVKTPFHEWNMLKCCFGLSF